jgi:hypothetical protein
MLVEASSVFVWMMACWSRPHLLTQAGWAPAVNVLANMHSSPAKGNFSDKHEEAQKLAIVQDIWDT